MFPKLPNGKPTNLAPIVVATSAITLGVVIRTINWPYVLSRLVLCYVAPFKERWFPSDDVSLSPESRGLAWFLKSGPPLPLDIQQIRYVTATIHPKLWGYDLTNRGILREDVEISKQRKGIVLRPKDTAATSGDTAILFIHGGGLIAGTTGTELGPAAEFCRRCQCPVLVVDYGLLPDVTLAEAVADVVAAFDYLTDRVVVMSPNTKIAIVGGSAGGILALLAAIQLRDRHRQQQQPNNRSRVIPASLALLSPSPGLEYLSNPPDTTWPSLSKNEKNDAFMLGGLYQFCRDITFRDPQNQKYLQSALDDLSGLPPSLVTVGEYEVILDGIHQLHNQLVKAGVTVKFKEYAKLQHVAHAFFFVSKESLEAFDTIVSWVLQP